MTSKEKKKDFKTRKEMRSYLQKTLVSTKPITKYVSLVDGKRIGGTIDFSTVEEAEAHGHSWASSEIESKIRKYFDGDLDSKLVDVKKPYSINLTEHFKVSFHFLPE